MERLRDPDRPGPSVRAGAIFLDEIAPGRTRARLAAADERTRIAADLHAQVVPAVRRALDEAEHGGSPDRLVETLRAVLADVDAMGAERHSITLDALGLVSAIEQLAERTEERSDVRITIDVASQATPSTMATDDGERPPRAVETAALRIAQLALENVVRHAPAATVRLEVVADPGRVRLVVADDGPGLAPRSGETAAAAGRRGLVDMRMAAESCGGSVVVHSGDGRGAVITFSWPADAQTAPQPYGMSRKPRGGRSAIPS
jgi:signal transduction histidine kinase